LGTNPIALAAPARHEAPMLFDAATSAIAGNKIRLAMRVGSPLLPGWVTDKEGTPIMEEKPVFDREEIFQAPLGGTREQGSHKGYGFALMAEVLSTLLAGALPTMLVPGSGSKNHFAAYHIEAFTDLEQFKTTMDEMLKSMGASWRAGAARAIGLVPRRGLVAKVGTTLRPAPVKHTPTMSSWAACMA